jgi:hypothetical protein
MRPRWTGTIPFCLEHISVVRHSAVEGKRRMSCRLTHAKESLNRTNERNAASSRAARGAAACAAHRQTV